MSDRPPQPPWFRHAPDQTVTGYRWLDLLTEPYWWVATRWTSYRFWRFMRVGDESWREARDRARRYFRERDCKPGGTD